ncbi:NB-ARC domain-containing protein [Roseateles sp.]|uniref:ATP-binding protein n=1 Tax=Roseateles sp. TaxID=1971397 RepID=UPI003263BE99
MPAVAGAARWTLRLLGAFELSDGTQRHGKLGTRAAMALLARLCLRPGNAHPREELVELLWPDAEAAAGRQRLRQTLSTLKQVLEPPEHAGYQVIEADRLSIRLMPDRVHCDAVAFEAAFKRGDHEVAHALYAGELLPGFFDEWIGDERLRLEGLHDRLRLPSAPVAATLPVAAPAAASADADAGPAQHRPALPAYLTRLIGVESQAALLRLEVAEHRLVTLMGPGGTGKTRLAVEVAQTLSQSAGSAFDMIVFVPLAACRTRQQLLDQMLLSLRLTGGKGGPQATLAQALDGRRVLLVLDNFEQLVDEGAEVVGELSAQLPLLHQLVTSRRALALPGEREVVAQALALPELDAPLAELALSPAVGLFVDRARASKSDFQLHEGNRAAVVDMVHLLDGMPLAIELAAARVRSMSPADMAASLRLAREGKASALDLLARAPQRGRRDTRHHSMQETIHWSWDLLDDALRQLLAALTVFQGGFTAAAAARVCASEPGAARDMPLMLDELMSHSLLRAQADGDSVRLSLYEPIREFAQRRLDGPAAARLRQAHGQWATSWAQALPVMPDLSAVQTEMPNLVAAMSNAVADGLPGAAIELALALAPTAEEISLAGAAVAALEAAVAACDDTLQKSRGLTLLGRLLFRSGRGNETLALAQQGLLLMPAGHPALRAHALLMATQAAVNAGERSRALLAQLDEAQAISEGLGDVVTQARIASCRADVVRVDDLAQAEALQRGALAVWEAYGDRIGVMRVRYNLAILAYRARNYEAMRAEIEPVIDEARRLQAWMRLSASLNVHGGALMGLRRWAEAAADTAASLRMAWQLLAPLEMAAAMSNLPYLLLRSGKPEEAVQMAGFFSVYWPARFGPLWAEDEAELRRVQRIARRVLGAARSRACFEQGKSLTPAQGVALALAAA